jgi:hypothetical protein
MATRIENRIAKINQAAQDYGLTASCVSASDAHNPGNLAGYVVSKSQDNRAVTIYSVFPSYALKEFRGQRALFVSEDLGDCQEWLLHHKIAPMFSV